MQTFMPGRWEDRLPGLEPGSVDLVLTDPPYANTKHAWDEEVDWLSWWAAIWRVTKPDAAVVVFGQGIHSARVMLSAERQYRYSWSWRANTTTGMLNAKRMPLRDHQDILVFYRKQPTYNPQMWHGKPSHRRSAGTRRDQFYGASRDKDQAAGDTLRYPRSTLEFDRVHVRSSVVPSQKPVPLLAYLIETYTNEGETVLDPFAGSGSLLDAARQTSRKGIVIEAAPDRQEHCAARADVLLDR